MAKTSLEQTCRELFGLAGIAVNGSNPWDIQVHYSGFYSRVLSEGSLGLGESYMGGWWDCQKLDEFFCRLLAARLDKKAADYLSLGTKAKIGLNKLKAKLTNPQNISKSRRVAEQHYNLGNYFFENMLGRTMAYSCGYWQNATTLNEAQEAKFGLICKKLQLKPGMTILDIGCGFGGLAECIAKKYKANVIGITLSQEQAIAASERCRDLNVEIRLQDYRHVKEKFDRVVSLGMLEHVGPKNYRKYFGVVDACLIDEGLFLLHTIGSLKPNGGTDPWLEKYIFPGGHLPSESQIIDSSYGLFVNEDLHNLRLDYARTLGAWSDNFTRNWEEIKKVRKYDEKFKRMIDYYLNSCKGGFESGKNQLWQFVFSKGRMNQGYNSVR